MEIIAGLSATIAIIGLGYATRQGRSLAFYGSVLIVIALVYVLFAVMAGAPRTIVIESAIAVVFIAVAMIATRWGTVRTAGWLLAAGLAAHGVYDLAHSAVVSNPVVPPWWPLFCGVVDLLLGAWILVGLKRGLLMVPTEHRTSRHS
jgi:hypothetical protein